MHCLCCVFIFTNVLQNVPGTNLTSCSLGAGGIISPVVSSPGVKRTIRFLPVPRLRKNSALLVLQARPCL